MQDADRQFTLPLRGPAQFRRRDFLAAPSNAAALRWLDHPQEWPDGRLVLFGGPGCGKTHLAHGWAGRVLPAPGGAAPRPLAGTRIALDDADRCADEPALLHLLNSIAEAGGRLLLTARLPPAGWPARLPDLISRLRATHAIGIEPPEDALLRALLARLLAERQLAVPQGLQDWLLLRLPRTAGAMRETVARLDGASLARRQPVTRGLARSCLAGLLDDGTDDLFEAGDDTSVTGGRQSPGPPRLV